MVLGKALGAYLVWRKTPQSQDRVLQNIEKLRLNIEKEGTKIPKRRPTFAFAGVVTSV